METQSEMGRMQTRHATGKRSLDSVPLLEISKKTMERELKRVIGGGVFIGEEGLNRRCIAMRLAYTFAVASLVDSMNALIDLTKKTNITENMVKQAIASRVNRVYTFDYFPGLFDVDLTPIISRFCDHSDKIRLSSTCKYLRTNLTDSEFVDTRQNHTHTTKRSLLTRCKVTRDCQYFFFTSGQTQKYKGQWFSNSFRITNEASSLLLSALTNFCLNEPSYTFNLEVKQGGRMYLKKNFFSFELEIRKREREEIGEDEDDEEDEDYGEEEEN
jgi:hypothetical protein